MGTVNVYKLMETFVDFIENKEDLPSEAKEAMREIQIVMTETLGCTKKTNGFGINDIKFELINQQKSSKGLQLNLEARGSAIVKGKEHLSRLLQRLVSDSREDLWKKNIFFEMMYHKVDMSENKLEMDETPLGLKNTVHFSVICAALIFT